MGWGAGARAPYDEGEAGVTTESLDRATTLGEADAFADAQERRRVRDLAEAGSEHSWEDLHAQVTTLVEAVRRGAPWPVEPGSVMAADSRATVPHTAVDAIRVALTAALQHLFALTSSHVEGDPLPAHVRASLARRSVEEACTALWLITPGNRHDRIARTLRWHAWLNPEPQAEPGSPARIAYERRDRQIRGAAAREGCPPHEVLVPLDLAEVVGEADARRLVGYLSPLTAWRSCPPGSEPDEDIVRGTALTGWRLLQVAGRAFSRNATD